MQKYTARVKKPENKIFKFFDPSRVFQRARACRNIRLGSKNRKTKSSSFLTRAVYFSKLELAEIYGSCQKTGHALSLLFDPSRIFQQSRVCEIYGSGQKTETCMFRFFDPNRIFQRARACGHMRFENTCTHAHTHTAHTSHLACPAF